MCLEKQVSLDMRRLKVVLVHLEWDQMRERFIEHIFIVPDWKPSELLGLRQDVDQVCDASVFLDGLSQTGDCLVRQIVERGEVP